MDIVERIDSALNSLQQKNILYGCSEFVLIAINIAAAKCVNVTVCLPFLSLCFKT